MVNYTAPGTHTEDNSAIAEPIEGVGTSTVAFVGGALDGPVLEPILVTTWDQFRKRFGGMDQSNKGYYLGYAVYSFFANQGQRAYIVRVAADPTADRAGDAGRTDVAYRKGLACLEALDDVDIVAMPDGTTKTRPAGIDRTLREDAVSFRNNRFRPGSQGRGGRSRCQAAN